MSERRKLEIALLILRLGIGSFFVVWASLKFYRPGWMVNVFKNTYGQAWISQDLGIFIGSLQMAIVLAFIAGVARFWSYGAVTVMLATGVLGSVPGLMNFTRFPNNLMWAGVAALAGMVALFILREHDNLLSISGRNRDRTPIGTV